jgi:hypothetical protein
MIIRSRYRAKLISEIVVFLGKVQISHPRNLSVNIPTVGCPRKWILLATTRKNALISAHNDDHLSAVKWFELLPTAEKWPALLAATRKNVGIRIYPLIWNHVLINVRVSIRSLGWCVSWRKVGVINLVGLSLKYLFSYHSREKEKFRIPYVEFRRIPWKNGRTEVKKFLVNSVRRSSGTLDTVSCRTVYTNEGVGLTLLSLFSSTKHLKKYIYHTIP